MSDAWKTANCIFPGITHISDSVSSYHRLSTVPTLCNYRKVPKFSDARKHYCNLPKIQEKRPNLRIFCQKDANGIANSSEDPDQTEQSDLGLHCLPRPICPKT